MKKSIIILSLLAAAALCSCCASVGSAYVEADESTLETVGAEWIAYVRADETLDDFDKEVREAKYESWRLRIKAAKEDQ